MSNKLKWSGDNRYFVIEETLPLLTLKPMVRQVIRWAYGYDGSDRSYEMESDGSSGVPDQTFNGMIKEPAGVGHDYINRVDKHTTPDGHKWTANESIKWYSQAMAGFNYSKLRRFIRVAGLYLSKWYWWK